MAFGAASRRGASQPATDGSQTGGAFRAPSGASLVEGHLTKHQAVTDADKKSDVAGLSSGSSSSNSISRPFWDQGWTPDPGSS